MLKAGDPVPAFSLPNADMDLIDVRSYQGQKNLVIYFYPKDDTPGCTKEAVDFSELMDEFQALDTVILGISRDSCISHANFRDKYGLSVELLADVDAQVCQAFGVLEEREKNGKIITAIKRSTFIVDKQGIIRHALYGVVPKKHAQQVLELVQAMTAEE